MSKVIFEDDAFEHYCDWARENYRIFEKIRDIVNDIKRSPFKGIGKPEPLKHQLKGYWSRRIDDKHRLVYRVPSVGEVFIVSCKGHYDL